LTQEALAKLSAAAFNKVFRGEFSQGDENESDKIGARMANKAGYIPNGIAEVLKKLAARNSGQQERNGMFASHPATKERIENNEKLIKAEKLNGKATAEARYKSYITFDAKPITEVATAEDGAAGLAAGDKKKDDKDAKKDDKKKSGLASITGGKEQASNQQTASAGARGVGGAPDRDATGGPNKSALGVKITAAELEAFKKGIA
jgi:predicted Zn-dependent protease